MTTTVEAIYEGGRLILPEPLPLPEKSHVMVTIQTNIPGADAFAVGGLNHQGIAGKDCGQHAPSRHAEVQPSRRA